MFSSDGQHQLSADGAALGNLAARDDRALLSGMVSDVPDRFAPVSRFDVLDFELLFGVAARPLPEDMVARNFLSPVRDGDRNRSFGAQRRGRYRSPRRQTIGIRAHAKVPDRRPGARRTAQA